MAKKGRVQLQEERLERDTSVRQLRAGAGLVIRARDGKTYFTKEELIEDLRKIANYGWIPNTRHTNNGAVGNTLEDMLGVRENNLPMPNTGDWELKCASVKSKSLTTLFHIEPSPIALKLVMSMLLPNYGWSAKNVNEDSSIEELSFRQTINTQTRSARGFIVIMDEQSQVKISFDANAIKTSRRFPSSKAQAWIESVRQRAGNLGELQPQPYWEFTQLRGTALSKLAYLCYARAEEKTENGQKLFKYSNIVMLSGFEPDRFFSCLRDGIIKVDFDASTAHNHGTKFRINKNRLEELYTSVVRIVLAYKGIPDWLHSPYAAVPILSATKKADPS